VTAVPERALPTPMLDQRLSFPPHPHLIRGQLPLEVALSSLLIQMPLVWGWSVWSTV
jgi:hypothetical protein